MADDSSPRTETSKTIGAHSILVHSADTIICRAQGDVSLAEIREVFAFIQAQEAPEKGFFYLSNISHMRHQSQQVADEMRKVPEGLIRAVGIVGATFAHRVLLDTMTRIAKFLKVSAFSGYFRFLATEEEAHAWFDRIRRGVE